MTNIPEEIILDIFVRVPVKSIGRFRCLNKTWYKLLNDGEFVRKHLNRANEINRLRLMLYDCVLDSYENDFHTIDYDPTSSTVCAGPYVNTNLSLLMNKLGLYDTFKFFGSCDGLVCVRPYRMDIVCLWNPVTNEYRDLPDTPFSLEHQLEDLQFGFGYVNGDYKVVCLVGYIGQAGSEVHVYSLNSDSWVTLESIPYTVYPQPDLGQVPVNAVIHWKAYVYEEGSERVRKILSFDIEKEIFQEMQWPNFLDETFSTNLCVLGGFLCLCCFNRKFGLEVWEFCGVGKFWRKLFFIDVNKHFGLVKGMMPLRSLKDGEILLGIDTNAGFLVHQYDTKHETTKPLIVYENSEEYSKHTTVCVESLVSLNSGIYVDDDASDNDEDISDDFDDEDDSDDEYGDSAEVEDVTQNENKKTKMI